MEVSFHFFYFYFSFFCPPLVQLIALTEQVEEAGAAYFLPPRGWFFLLHKSESERSQKVGQNYFCLFSFAFSHLNRTKQVFTCHSRVTSDPNAVKVQQASALCVFRPDVVTAERQKDPKPTMTKLTADL